VVRVLLVEDDEDDYLITSDMLARQDRVQFVLDWRASFHEALEAIQNGHHDVYLIDYRLGEHTGLDLVREAFASRPFASVIMLTGQAAIEIDLEATALGVTDYLVKQELDPSGLERSIRYAIRHQKAISDLSRSEERYALAMRAVNDGVWDWDLLTDRVYFSPRWHMMLGRPELVDDQRPSVWFDLVHPSDVAVLRAALEAHVRGAVSPLESEHRMRHADGSWRWMRTRGLAIHDEDGVATRMAGSLSDVTEQRGAQVRLQHDALHDSLTELPNRTLFMNRVEHVLDASRRDAAGGCALLFLDVDGFKLVNDSLSHAVGDNLLIALAARFSSALRPGDTVARLGGDEFIVLLEDVVDADSAVVVAERILRAIEEPFTIDGNELFVSVSVGIALSAPDSHAVDLIRDADIAMYDAKRRGRAGSAIFDASMRRRVVTRQVRETELRQAIDGSLLGIHYQPIVELATGRICGLEALSRWPAGWPPLSPTEFISIAEEIGVIDTLGEQMMQLALRTLAGWRRDGVVDDAVCMSINLSGRQLDNPRIAEQVLAAIDSVGLSPGSVKLEITESTLMREVQRVQKVFAAVCATGVGLHLDDFGTGYSSLTALRQFPVDTLKIDRSFIGTVSEQDDDKLLIVRSTVALAHSLGLAVIAEGIECAEQLQRLRSLGCEYGQGYLFSRALNAHDIRILLETWRADDVIGLAATT
jgi:diguanylate cyclase (GGDEF)-like protein/PAS domain S-box-containing protein